MLKVTRREFCKAVAIGGATALLPPTRSAQGATTFFNHTAETSPITGSSSSSYHWDEAQSLVSRSQDITPKSGSWALRHNIVLPGDIQTGKVLKFIAPWTGMPGSAEPGHIDRYYSCWFYFPAGGKYSSNWNNIDLFTNNFQWKCDGHSAYQDGPMVPQPIGAKIIFSLQWINNAPLWYFLIYRAKYVPGGPGTDFPLNYFSYNAAGRVGAWANPNFEIPFGEWVFLEIRLKASEQNGHIQVWSGKASEGVLYLLHDMSDPLLNTLTMWNGAFNDYSSNRFLYWDGGNYLDSGHSSGTWTLYTDDWRLADFQVGPTLPEFEGGEPPPPPSSLQISRKLATNRNISSNRIQSSGRTQ